MRYRFVWIVLFLALGLAGCAQDDALREVLKAGELVVVSRNGPTTYYLDKEGPAGFEYAMAQAFADELGVALKMEPAFSLQGIFDTLQRHEADFAAAGLTLTPQRADQFPHSIAYDRLTAQVVYRAGSYRPRKAADMVGMRIVTLADSSHAQALARLRENGLDALNWRELPEADTMELLDLIDRGAADLALIDSAEFDVQQSLYPRLKVAFDLTDEQSMVWYLPPGRDHSAFLDRMNAFIERMHKNGRLGRLQERHFGHTAGFSRISSHTFTLMMRRALPPYEAMIKTIAREYQVDWQLLAAIAYQESHWDPHAESPTGVRGMMMLTLPTAREMGVDNRLDAAQSLRGGARYFKNLKRRLSEKIREPDRTWMALAAYNIGKGHLEDARRLTQRDGGNPNLWGEVMQRLPLLEKRSHYKATHFGYARGREAVTYVQNIRHYLKILQWQDIPENQALAPLKIDEYVPPEMRHLVLKAL